MNRIKELRLAHDPKMSQEKLGALVGVGRTAVAMWETGKSVPSNDVLVKLTNIFGVSMEYLLGLAERPGPDLAFAKFTDEAPPEYRESVQHFVNTYPGQARIGEQEKTPSLSDAALKLARDYDSLDRFGKKQLRDVADNEIARCEDEVRFLADAAPPEEPKIIPLFRSPAAAGYASPVFGQDFDPYKLKPEDPQGAVFAVRLQGDSMEPDFPDGSIVFCNRDPLADGDIGVFNVDGNAICKQYHREGSMTYLFSLNRKRQDADVLLLPGGDRSLVCQGRVITKKRYRVPGR